MPLFGFSVVSQADWDMLKSQLRSFDTKLNSINSIISALVIIADAQMQFAKNQEAIMATLAELVAAVEAEKTQVDSITTLVGQLKSMLDAALANAGTLTPEQQAAIDSVFAQVTDDTNRIAEAVAANTPAA